MKVKDLIKMLKNIDMEKEILLFNGEYYDRWNLGKSKYYV